MTRRIVIVGCLAGVSVIPVCFGADTKATAKSPAAPRALINQYCFGCHNPRLKSGGLSFDSLDPANIAANPATWEKVVTKLRAGLMPPAGAPRPD